jgi:general secretion pathway protein G
MNSTGQIASTGARRAQQGFSLFELVVYLLVASMLFATVMNRYREFPGEAERANFTAILAQLKAGVNLQMMDMIASSDWGRAAELEGSNPMDLMLEQPSNYVGAFAMVELAAMPRRVWYFDTTRGELVYLADNADNLYVTREDGSAPSDNVRFRINSMRAEAEAETDAALSRWQGLTLLPVEPYTWRQVPLELQAAAE